MSRADQYDVRVTLVKGTDQLALKTFDKLSGGEVDSEETKYRPGGMQPQVTLGGYTSVGNITVSRLYDKDRDIPVTKKLLQWVGRADATVSKQFLDTDGNPFGNPVVYVGKLKAVTLPEHDSESSDAALIELEISSASIQTS